ncbi:hypothetical protein IMSAGC018_01425 [Lachnospiraceae bacterium]|nr:hypothetical protein IMSAGC018_01425 [Lachnospiraceae bacterium]
MTMLRDLSIYWSMLHILIVFILLFRPRFDRKKTVLITGICMGVLMLLNGGLLAVAGFEVLGNVFLITCTVPSLILFYVLSADRNFKFFFSFCLADTSCLWIMAVTNLLDYFLGGGQYMVMFVSRLIAFPLVEYLIWRYLRKPYLELQEGVQKGWGIFSGMTMLYYVLLAVTVQYPTNIVNRLEDIFQCVLILLLMLLNYATIFTSLYRQLLLYRKQQSERILLEQKNLLKAQLENQQRIRRMKHDMKGYSATLLGLLAEGKTKEALVYLKGVETEMDTLEGAFCANPYINAVFVQYSGKLEELGAEYTMNIQAGEAELPYMELCQILSNGLENACDALEKLEIEKREASVEMKYNRQYLIIQIKNRCREDLCVERGNIPTTDKAEPGHGFGLPTIQTAAGRIGGDMMCYTEEGNFVLEVMVSLAVLRERMKQI